MHLAIVTCYIKACETEWPNNLHLFSSCLNGEYRDQNTHQSWDAGEEGVELARQLTEAVFSCGVITSDWEESFILNLYKGKSGALDRGNYRGLKLTGEGMKLLEWVLVSNICEMWTLTRCSSALCLVEVSLMPSSLFANCRRSTSQLTNYFTSSLCLCQPW